MIQSIREYNVLNEMKHLSNYSSYDTIANSNLAEFINKSYDTMSDTDLLLSLSKCMPTQFTKSLLLKYELENYTPNKLDYMSLSKVKPIISSMLYKYTWKAGGFSIEDNEWSCYDYNTTEHTVKEYELIFTNTIHSSECYTNETCEFLYLIVNRLNNLATNIRVNTSYKEVAKMIMLRIHVKDMILRKSKRSKNISL